MTTDRQSIQVEILKRSFFEDLGTLSTFPDVRVFKRPAGGFFFVSRTGTLSIGRDYADALVVNGLHE